LRERQEEVAAQLHAEIVELMKITPQVQMDPRAAREPLATAHRRLREAEARSAALAEPRVTARMRALDVAMFIAEFDTGIPARETVNFWPLSVALSDVLQALVAFQRHEDPPEPNFPPVDKLSELAWPEGRTEGIDGVMRYLLKEQAKKAGAEEQGGSDC
jgi:hypothetical protein